LAATLRAEALVKVIQPLIATVLAIVITTPAHASECGGVTMGARRQVADTQLTLNGMGIREATIFNVDVYVAGLYLEAASRNATDILQGDTKKQLVLHFVRDVERADIQKAFAEGFQHSLGAAAADIARLKGWVADMHVGEEMIYTYVPGIGLEVKVRGSVKGTIAAPEFTRAFLGIWLGASPPNAGLKRGLLGGSCG
jgi:hypothetical protein